MIVPRPAALLVLLVAMAGAGCREDGGIRIASLDFEGVEQVSKGDLASALQTQKGSWLPWGRQRYFDRRAFEADLQRIAAFYRDRGFPDARVTATDIELNDQQTEVRVTVHIQEGEPIVVGAVEFVGFEVLPDRERRRIEREIPLREDQPLDTQLASASRERALNALRDHGYPYAAVRLRNEPIEPRRERVVLQAEPGTLAHFGPIEVNGEASVGERVLLRQLSFEPGDTYSREKMRESQRKLYGMELFQFVNVESLEDQAEVAAEVPVRITVGESKHRHVTFGLGYGSEERARARIRWDHVNFFGGARQAGFEGRWSSLDRGVRAEFTEPYVFHPDLSLNLQAQAWQAEEPVYSQNTVGGRAVLRYQISPQNFASVSIIGEYQTSSVEAEALLPENFDIRDDLIALGLDPRGFDTEGTLNAVAFDFGRNTTNNLLDARRGYVVNAHLERALQVFGGTYDYWSASLEGRHYVSVGSLFILANRLTLGTIEPAGEVEATVPFHKRFFLGGATSNRGWGRFEVSPLSGFGFPIGGLSMLDGSTEVRFPVWGSVGGVLFLDYSNVWTDAFTFDVDGLRYAVGPGLRYRTPIGPIRVDLGYQLNSIEGLLVDGEPQKRPWRVHFSIGQAF
jgi:outer membrane protein assembly complex protein YaeT